jgi:hypothetical protein
LTRAENATGAGWESEKKTWAESKKERCAHEEIGLCEYETHRASNETVNEEEHKCVEKNSRLVGLAVHELDILARGGNENTGAECEKKSSR